MKKIVVFSITVLIILICSLGFTGISQGATQRLVDLNLDGIVDFTDYSLFARDWLQDELRFELAHRIWGNCIYTVAGPCECQNLDGENGDICRSGVFNRVTG